MRKSRSNILNRVLACVLATTIVMSAGLSTALTAFATSGGSGSAGTGYGGGGRYLISGGMGLLKISASRITDNSTVDEMADMDVRYGALESYPLFVHSGGYHGVDIIKKCETDVSKWGTWQNGDTGYDNAVQEYNKSAKWCDSSWWKPSTRSNYQYELKDARNIVKYRVATDNNDNAIGSETIYLEDCLRAVMENKLQLSAFDKNCFWYFYTRIMYGEANDMDLYGTGTSTLGDSLRKAITNRVDGITVDGIIVDDILDVIHECALQRGYIVALALVYGVDSEPVTTLLGSSFNTIDKKGEAILQTLQNGIWKDDYCSLVIDRMEAVKSSNVLVEGSYTDCFTAMTVHDFLDVMEDFNSSAILYSTMKEGSCFLVNLNAVGGNNTPAYIAGHDSAMHGGAYEDLMGFCNFVKWIYPARVVNGKPQDIVDSNNKKIFGGWGYFPFTAPPPSIKITLPNTLITNIPEYENIATSVTYNAYLSNDNEFNMELKNNAYEFGDLSHVATDLVMYTTPIAVDNFPTSDGQLLGQTDDVFFNFAKVENKITLSAPFKDTQYNLERVMYRITNANGGASTLKSTNGNLEYVTALPLEDNATDITVPLYITNDVQNVRVTTEHLKTALGNNLAKLQMRKKRDVSIYNAFDYGFHNTGYDTDSEATRTYLYLYTFDGRKYNKITRSSLSFLSATLPTINTTITDVLKYVTTFDITEAGKAYKLVHGSYPSYPTTKTETEILNNGDIKSDFYYVDLFNKGVFTPIRYQNGKWTLYPLTTITNLLVQIRADYVGTISENDSSKFKNVSTEPYLLSKNVATDDFLTTGTKVWSMLDEYSTDEWGTINLREYVKKSVKKENGTVYHVATDLQDLIDSWIEAYNNNANASDAMTDMDTARYNMKVAHGKLRYYMSEPNKYSYLAGKERAVRYVTSIIKTSPYLNKDTYTNMTDSGTKVGMAGGVNPALNVGVRLIKDTTVAEVQNNGVAVSVVKSGSSTSKAENGLSDSMYTFTDFGTGYDYEEVARQSTKIIGNTISYSETDFNKLLTTYKQWYYKTRQEVAPAITPKYAGWLPAQDASDLSLQKGYEGTVFTKEQEDLDYGFLRFGKVNVEDVKGAYRVVENNIGLPASSIYVNTSTNQTETVCGVSNSKSLWLPANITQSAYDIPVNVEVKARKAGTTSTNFPATTYGNTGLTDTEVISSSAVPHVEGSWSVVKVYPEVTMWGEKEGTKTQFYTAITVGQREREIPNVTYSTLSLENTTPSVKVTATATAYDTRAKKLAERLGSENAPVLYSGTALNIAVGGTGGKVTTYVLGVSDRYKNDSDVALGQVWHNKESKVVATQAMQELLSPLSAVSEDKLSIVSNSLTSFDLNSNSSTTAVTLSGNVNQQVIYYELKVESGVLKSVTAYRGNTALQTYTVNGTSVTTGTQNSDTLTATQLQTVLTQMKLIGADSVLKTSFEYDEGGAITGALGGIVADRFKANWYQEDCSTLAIKVFEGNVNLGAKTYSEQIPITLGPKTPSNKNSYFSSGYKGYIDTTTEIKYTGTAGTVNSLTVENVRSTRPDINSADFIVSDVTINEATGF